MPNWVYNTIEFLGDKKTVTEIIKKHLVKGEFDFDTIIPEPRKIEDCPKHCIATPSSGITEEPGRPWFNWYNWHCEFWGTKWNACETKTNLREQKVEFDTAWAEPGPVFIALSKMYPDIEFKFSWIEEQGAENVGIVFMKNGIEDTTRSVTPSPWTKEAFELMFEFWGNSDSYAFDADEDNYLYVDDEYYEFASEWDRTHDTDEPLPSTQDWYDNYGGKEKVAKSKGEC